MALAAAGFIQIATADDAKLPAETTALLEKLKAFESSQSLELDVKIEKAEKSALAILAKHQEKAARGGNLDTVLALRGLTELGGVKEFDPKVPAESKAVVLKFQDYATAQRAEHEAKVDEKRQAVVRLLRQQVERQTKDGNVDVAVAIRTFADKLAAASPAKPKKKDSSKLALGEKSKVGRTLAKIAEEPGAIEVVNTEPVSVVKLKEEADKKGEKGKWSAPPEGLLELGALVHSPTSSSNGVATYKVTAPGYVIVSCDYAYQGNSGGGWVDSRWTAEDFKENGWKELDEKDLGGHLLTSKGGVRKVFYKKLKEGESGELRCNKYGPPIFLTIPAEEES